jgi:hypothetical protein
MKKEVKMHIRSFPNLTTADCQFKMFPNAFLMNKKVTFKGFPCPSKNKYGNEIGFRLIYELRGFF